MQIFDLDAAANLNSVQLAQLQAFSAMFTGVLKEVEEWCNLGEGSRLSPEYQQEHNRLRDSLLFPLRWMLPSSMVQR